MASCRQNLGALLLRMAPTWPTAPVALVAPLALLACAHVPPPASAPPSADAALSRMRATLACGQSMQASAKVDRFGEGGRVRGDVLLFAGRPARLRMDF